MRQQIKKWTCILAVLLVFSIVLSAAEWYVEYDRAREAARKSDWPVVIATINQALKEKNTPQSDAKTYGVNFVDYYPYYYLGLAYYKLGRYTEAQSAFEKSLAYGTIKKSRYIDELQEMLQVCREKNSPPVNTPVKPGVDQSLAEIRELVTRGDNSYIDHDYKTAREAYTKARSLAQKNEQQRGLLAAIETKLGMVAREETISQLLAQADVLYNNKQYKEAGEKLGGVLALDPANAQALRFQQLIAAEVMRASGNSTGKVTPPPTVTNVKPTSPSFAADHTVKDILAEGKQLFASGRYAEAREKFSGVLQLQPQDKEAQQWLFGVDYAAAIQELNLGVQCYFASDLAGSERACRDAIRMLGVIEDASLPPDHKSLFPHQQKLSPGDQPVRLLIRKALVRAYQFLAIVLIEKHYLGIETTNQGLQEANQLVDRIYDFEPGFQLETKYFSPRVVGFFTPRGSR